MAAAIAAFVNQLSQGVRDHLPELRELIEREDGASDSVDDVQLYAEMLPAALAIGLQPVRNIWDQEKFEEAREEAIRFLDTLDDNEVSNYLKMRLNELLSAWNGSASGEGVNLPWDELSGNVLANLGVCHMKAGEGAIISPTAILGVSSILVTLPGTFWKDIEQKFELSSEIPSMDNGGLPMSARELSEAIGEVLKAVVSVDNVLFKFQIRNLFKPMDFAEYCSVLDAATNVLEEIQVGIQQNPDHWKPELGEEGFTLVVAYLSSLKDASAKLRDISGKLELKAKRHPYSGRQYKADVRSYQQSVDAYVELGNEMNSLFSRIT